APSLAAYSLEVAAPYGHSIHPPPLLLRPFVPHSQWLTSFKMPMRGPNGWKRHVTAWTLGNRGGFYNHTTAEGALHETKDKRISAEPIRVAFENVSLVKFPYLVGPREEGTFIATSIDRVSVAFSVDPGEKAYFTKPASAFVCLPRIAPLFESLYTRGESKECVLSAFSDLFEHGTPALKKGRGMLRVEP
ncbi:hypothetical protein L195_g031599, partial [Trifolium pratense]